MKMTDDEFKVKFDKLRSQELKMGFVLKGMQKVYHQMPNSRMNPALHRHDLAKGSETMTVEDRLRHYYQLHLVPEAQTTVKDMVEIVFYLCNQDQEARANYAIAMHNTFDKLLMLIDQYEGKEPNHIEFFD